MRHSRNCRRAHRPGGARRGDKLELTRHPPSEDSGVEHILRGPVLRRRDHDAATFGLVSPLDFERKVDIAARRMAVGADPLVRFIDECARL